MKMGTDLQRHPVCDNMPHLCGFAMQYSMGGISGIYRIGYKKSHDQLRISLIVGGHFTDRGHPRKAYILVVVILSTG
ncbi:hypothetical protein, partial [Acidithiobacillus ferrivorans]|uniref:hypothetical protein n=1 Tax=Acidithiobacillus ferrivorans TaxID=160808 RepID=UPI001C4008BF